MNVCEWLSQATHTLACAKRDSPRLSAELMLAHVLACERIDLLTWPEKTLDLQQIGALSDLLRRRKAGEPIAYLIGSKEFYGLKLAVNQATLIPRPDTECLVDCVLAHYSPKQSFRFADLGTGCGNIAIAIAKHRPLSSGYACDASIAALRMAKKNCTEHNVDKRIATLACSFTQLPFKKASLDLIVANPPYIAYDDHEIMDEVLNFEPKSALFAANNGLADLLACISQATYALKKGGMLMLEHGHKQGFAVRQALTSHFFSAKSKKDLAGHERISYGSFQQRI